MKRKVNSYVSMLFITIIAAGAALLIINMVDADRVGAAPDGTNAASYDSFKKALLDAPIDGYSTAGDEPAE